LLKRVLRCQVKVGENGCRTDDQSNPHFLANPRQKKKKKREIATRREKKAEHIGGGGRGSQEKTKRYNLKMQKRKKPKNSVNQERASSWGGVPYLGGKKHNLQLEKGRGKKTKGGYVPHR